MLIQEPTSGLDAALALQVMTTLRSYATDQNKTIVTTIHQPSSQIFHMFQNVLLLADGQVIEFCPIVLIHDINFQCTYHPTQSLHPTYPTPPISYLPNIPYLLAYSTPILYPKYPTLCITYPSDTLSSILYHPGKNMGPGSNPTLL